MKIKTSFLTIILVLLMGCAGLQLGGNNYIPWAERYPEAAQVMNIPTLGECVEYNDGSTFCLTGEVEVPMPENATVLEMDKDACRFIQRVDSDRYDGNLDGEADMYFLLIFLPNKQQYSGNTIKIDENSQFYKMVWSQITAEYERLTGKKLEDSWNTREMNIPVKEEKESTEF